MKIFHFSLLLLVLTACAPPDTRPTISSANLIGGELAPADNFRSTVYIFGICTAAKIAKKTFITAAHCISNFKNGENNERFLKGSSLYLLTHYGVEAAVRVARAEAHPSYKTALKELIQKGEAIDLASFKSYDVAIFNVLEETPKIPVAKLNFEELPSETDVVMGGHGCEKNIHEILSPTKRHYRIDLSKAYRVSETDFDLGDEVDKFFFLTRGKGLDDSYASLCLGDSGGPVYAEEDGAVVGINAAGMGEDGSAYFAVHAHSRLSGLKEWINNFLK